MNKKSKQGFFCKDYWGSTWENFKKFEAEISPKNKDILGSTWANLKEFEAA